VQYIHRNGKYHYFRYDGVRGPRLRGEPGSPEYVAHFEELLQLATTPGVIQFPKPRRLVGRPLKASVPRAGAKVFLPGSIGWAVQAFVTSKVFANYAPGTREGHRACLHMIRSSDMGAAPLVDLDRTSVRHYCGKIAETRGSARADQVRRCLSLLWQFACTHLPQCKIDEERANPARGIGQFHKVRRPHAKWSPHVERAFLADAPDHLRLAFHLARYTGFRRGDVCDVKWTQYDEQSETLYLETEKTSEYVPMYVVPRLRELLAATERRSETILCDPQGGQVSRHTLTSWFAKRLRALGIKGMTLHGLRVTLAVELAENGASVQQIMYVLGHKTAKMALHYCREANKQQMIRDAMTAQRPEQLKLRSVS
jgi:integrase